MIHKTRTPAIPALVAALALALPIPSGGQTAPPAAPKSLSSTLGIYVFPTTGQDAATQSKDEAECYSWAVQNSGVDPFQLQKQSQAAQQQAQAQQQQIAQSGQGAGVKGAVGGAAAGALIGEIASDDAGEGAAWGAAAGAVIARRGAKKQKAAASQQVAQSSTQTQQSLAEQQAAFKKAFSVCLEAKKYMVKY